MAQPPRSSSRPDSGYLCCMKAHDSPASRNGRKGQQRRGSKLIMQVHENRCIKRAGVAGLRVRAGGHKRIYFLDLSKS